MKVKLLKKLRKIAKSQYSIKHEANHFIIYDREPSGYQNIIYISSKKEEAIDKCDNLRREFIDNYLHKSYISKTIY